MAERTERLMALLPEAVGEQAVDGALITSPANRLYLTGMETSAGYVLVTRREAYFIVDFRYYEAACKQVSHRKVVEFSKIGETLKELARQEGLKGILLEYEGISLSSAQQMETIFHAAGARVVKDRTLDRLLHQMRRIKEPGELREMNTAQEITDAAFSHILAKIKEGITERELALEIEFFMRRNGAESVSFDLIVVSGKNGSLPHGVPEEKPVEKGDFITMDIGAVYHHYCSDMTRTVALGQVTDEQKQVYETVLKAQLAALAAIGPGKSCKEVDAAARDLITQAGYGRCFGHATGHSVGLEIHEEPRCGPSSPDILEPGVVMTVEPGIYLPDRFGVRIEDMVVITENGYQNFTKSSKELILL